MSGVLVNQGEVIMLEALINKAAGEDLVLKLFQNDWTPGETDTEGDYVEADFSGYAAIPLDGASWTTTPGAPSQVTYAQQSFISDADQTLQPIYGYFLVQLGSGLLVAAERFASAFPLQNVDDTVKVTPKITQN